MKTELIKIRVEKYDKALIEKAAQSAGKSTARFCREVLLNTTHLLNQKR